MGRTWTLWAVGVFLLTCGLGSARAQTIPAPVIHVAPDNPSDQDVIVVSFTLEQPFGYCTPAYFPPSRSGNRITIRGDWTLPGPIVPCNWNGHAEFAVGPLPAGSYTVDLMLQLRGAPLASASFEVHSADVPPVTALPLLSGRFLATVERAGSGPAIPAHAVPLGDQSGYFWFFDRDNVEITAKILDGRDVNGKIWVFLASMTDLPFQATVYDLGDGTCAAALSTCSKRTYINPPGRIGNFLDTAAFDAAHSLSPAGGRTAGVPPDHRLVVSPRFPTAADPVEVRVVLGSRCTALSPTIQVDGSVIRFDLLTEATCPTTPLSFPPAATVGPLPPGVYQVQARVDGVPLPVQTLEVTPAVPALDFLSGVELTLDWQLPGGGGRAHPVALSSESGYFWFFDPKSAEVTVKLLDGRAVNGHLWLFLASMTDVAYTLTVVDRRVPDCSLAAAGCPTKTYTGTAGKNANRIDLQLF